MIKKVIIFCLGVIFCFFAFGGRGLASCNTSTLTFTNTTINKNRLFFAGESYTVRCNSGFLTPELKNAFNVLCKKSVSYNNDYIATETDNWFFIEALHKCEAPATWPHSQAAGAIGCYNRLVNLANSTNNASGTKTPHQAFVTITCNAGYGAGSVNEKEDGLDLSRYSVKKSFQIQCLDGRFYGHLACLPVCDIDRLKSQLPASQTADTEAKFAAPGDFVTIKCASGGIKQTGLTNYKAYCHYDTECKDQTTGLCSAKSFFTIRDIGFDKIINTYASREAFVPIDANLKTVPNCSPKYLPCTNAQITTEVGASKIEENDELKMSIFTPHGGGVKVTCINSAGTRNAGLQNFDQTTGRSFRLFNCDHGVWDPDPSVLICPDRDCEDNESCGYEYRW